MSSHAQCIVNKHKNYNVLLTESQIQKLREGNIWRTKWNMYRATPFQVSEIIVEEEWKDYISVLCYDI